ncbi:MAG TPA: Abi-alpha family protein, partial [Pedobacter sp.]
MDLEKIANIFGAETVKKIYDDGLSKSVQQLGDTSADIIKALRLFTAPFQLLATYQERLTRHLNKVAEAVPEEKQIEAPPSISGPIIERLKYLEDGNPMTSLFLNLLTRAIDKDRINEAHPGFIHVIDQLSSDEATLLFHLSKG